MNCTDCEKLLHRYLADELDAAGRERVEFHLRQCLACTDELARARAFDELLVARPTLAVPPDFLARVVARAQAESPAPAATSAWDWRAAIEKLLQWEQPLPAFQRVATAGLIALVTVAGFGIGRMILVKSRPAPARTANQIEVVPAEARAMELMLRASYGNGDSNAEKQQ